ncbi:MAG: hypothetical protein KDD62_15505, partial [Bdellovibrionales bacterium]|nr:hypothetical protein [Bdellovibrionales bacterium]
ISAVLPLVHGNNKAYYGLLAKLSPSEFMRQYLHSSTSLREPMRAYVKNYVVAQNDGSKYSPCFPVNNKVVALLETFENKRKALRNSEGCLLDAILDSERGSKQAVETLKSIADISLELGAPLAPIGDSLSKLDDASIEKLSTLLSNHEVTKLIAVDPSWFKTLNNVPGYLANLVRDTAQLNTVFSNAFEQAEWWKDEQAVAFCRRALDFPTLESHNFVKCVDSLLKLSIDDIPSSIASIMLEKLPFYLKTEHRKRCVELAIKARHPLSPSIIESVITGSSRQTSIELQQLCKPLFAADKEHPWHAAAQRIAAANYPIVEKFESSSSYIQEYYEPAKRIAEDGTLVISSIKGNDRILVWDSPSGTQKEVHMEDTALRYYTHNLVVNRKGEALFVNHHGIVHHINDEGVISKINNPIHRRVSNYIKS